jgi:hypothetical protein
MVGHVSLRHLHALLAVIWLHALACRAPQDSFGIARRFEALNVIVKTTASLPTAHRAAAVASAYDELFASLPAHALAATRARDELAVLFQAAHLTASYTLSERHVRAMAAFLGALEERGHAGNAEYQRMYKALVTARMLSEAREFAGRHPLAELEPLPELHEAADLVPGLPTEWTVDPDRRVLLHRNVYMDPVQILVVSHPMCHFSQAAVGDIQADATLDEVFRSHAKWLALPDAIYFDVIQKWNKEHTHQVTTLTNRREEWPMIDTWATPTFYFIKDGAVVAKVIGWPKEGRRADLIAAARQIGLL